MSLEWTFDKPTYELTEQDIFDAIIHPVVDGHLDQVELPEWKWEYLQCFLLEYRTQVARELAQFLRDQAATYSYTRAGAFRSAAAKIDPDSKSPQVKGFWNQGDW